MSGEIVAKLSNYSSLFLKLEELTVQQTAAIGALSKLLLVFAALDIHVQILLHSERLHEVVALVVKYRKVSVGVLDWVLTLLRAVKYLLLQ